MDVRKLRPQPETNLPPVNKARLKKMIEEAVVDAYNEDEQTVGFLTMIQDRLFMADGAFPVLLDDFPLHEFAHFCW